jgi:Tfp pilus assembly protein PilF
VNSKKNIIFIALIAVLVYANSLGNGFIWDEIFGIINNDFIKGPRLIKEIFLKPFYYFLNPDYLYYRPIQALSNMLDYSLWGLNPFGFHLTNLFLHICAAILIYFFINILCSNQELSFFTSLLFVVHPINTPTVACLSSRGDLFLTIFSISSLILFLKAEHYKYYLISVLCFILALLSKETALVFPLCLIFTKEMYNKMKAAESSSGILIARLWYPVFLIIPIAYLLVRTNILGMKSFFLPTTKLDISVILFTSFKITINYLKIIFFPFNLHMLRTVPIVQATPAVTILSVIFIICSLIGLVVVYRLSKIVFLAAGIFLIWLIPLWYVALRHPEYYFQQKAIMEQHWIYVSVVSMLMLIIYALKKLGKHFGNIFYKAIFLLLIICLSIITIKENTFWKDNYTFFTHTLKYVDYSPTLYKNLGWIYLNKHKLDKSISMYQRALNIKQEDKSKIILNKDLAYAYLLNNQIEKAIDAVGKALSIKYNYADGHGYLGLIYSTNDLPKAKEEWKIALDIDSFNDISFNNLLNLSRSDNEIRDYLIKKYESLPKQDSRFADFKIYRALGIAYLYNGRYSLALSNLTKALKINPYDVRTNNALAVYYAETRDFDNAVKLFKRTLRLNPFDKEVYKNFALLYSQLNQEEEARQLIQKSESFDMFE